MCVQLWFVASSWNGNDHVNTGILSTRFCFCFLFFKSSVFYVSDAVLDAGTQPLTMQRWCLQFKAVHPSVLIAQSRVAHAFKRDSDKLPEYSSLVPTCLGISRPKISLDTHLWIPFHKQGSSLNWRAVGNHMPKLRGQSMGSWTEQRPWTQETWFFLSCATYSRAVTLEQGSLPSLDPCGTCVCVGITWDRRCLLLQITEVSALDQRLQKKSLRCFLFTLGCL